MLLEPKRILSNDGYKASCSRTHSELLMGFELTPDRNLRIKGQMR